MSTFTIRGFAQREVEYDLVKVKISFYAVSSDAENASKQVMDNCETFLENVSKIGVKPNLFYVDEDNSSECNSNGKMMYKAIRRISLKMKVNMKAINAIRELLVQGHFCAGFDTEYILTNKSQIMDELISEAILNSKKKAEEFADILNMRVVGIENAEMKEWHDFYGCGADLLGLDDTTEIRKAKYVKSTEMQPHLLPLESYIDVKWNIE